MRTYHTNGYRLSTDGSIEIEGTWSLARSLASLVSVLLVVVVLLRSRFLAVPAVVVGLYLLVLPPRRRIVVDAALRVLRIEHAGAFREPDPGSLPFAAIRSLRLAPARSSRRRNERALIARTGTGEVYLMTLASPADVDELAARLSQLIGVA